MADHWEPPEEPEPGRSRPGPGRLLGVLGAVVAALVSLNLLTAAPGDDADGTDRTTGLPRTPTSTRLGPTGGISAPPSVARPKEPCPGPLSAVAIGGDPLPVGAAVEQWQCEQESPHQQGAVLRRTDGTLGRRSAVVIWPVSAYESAPTGLTASPDGGRRELVWPLGGDFARIRGDLSERELIVIAAAVRTSADVLHVEPPKGFRLVYNGRYAAQHVHQIGYNPQALGVTPSLGYDGMVLTGLQRAADFEDEMYAGGTVPTVVGSVHGRPAVLSRRGTSMVVAWEPEPGDVAYVGAPARGRSATATLLSLAQRTVLLSPEEFQSMVR